MEIDTGDILTNNIGLVLEIEDPTVALVGAPSNYRTLGGIWKAIDSAGMQWLVTPQSLLNAGFRKENGE